MFSESTIILSAFFTLFTTFWCCIRPDFSSPLDSKLRALSTKLNLAFWVVTCPELVLFWATRQWLEAGAVANEFQDHGWTRRHGFFFLMGGFILCDDDGRPNKTLSLTHFKRLLQQKVIKFPRLTSLDIQERSNLHPSMMLIGLLQTIWFLAQCLSRFINASSGGNLLAVTQLEAIAAAAVMANWCILFFAWQKPLDPQYHILIRPIIPVGSLARHNRILRLQQGLEVNFRMQENLWGDQIKERRFQFEHPQSRSTIRSIIPNLFTGIRITPHSLISIILWPFQSVYHDILNLYALPDEVPELPDGTLKIPLFYVQVTVLEFPFLLPSTFLSMGVSIVSLTLILRSGSTLSFCSERVQLVWRIAAITSSSLSALMLAIVIVINVLLALMQKYQFDRRLIVKLMDKVGYACVNIFLGTSIFGIAPLLLARLVLVVASLISLRSLQGGSFVDLSRSWTDYLPHMS